jgi:hypothetical protein
VSRYERVVLVLLTLAHAAEATPSAETASDPSTSAEPANPPWHLSFKVYGFYFPDQSGYLQPTVTVDHGWLHLEARYNDEALQTGSLWVGWNLAWGDALKFSLTPMIGGIFGKENGFAPGLEWLLAWGPLELSSENEFVIDLVHLEQSYFYAWSELHVRPFAWLRVGAALQRTKVHAVPRTASWAPLVGVSVWKVEVAVYWFNPGQADAQYWAVYVALHL